MRLRDYAITRLLQLFFFTINNNKLFFTMTEYLKSLSTDFNGNIEIDQFHAEIVGNADITTPFLGLSTYLDDIIILFDSVLSNAEVATLNGIISNHLPDSSPKRILAYRIYPEIRKVKSDNWTSVGSFEFPGTKYNGEVNYVDIISAAEISGMTYNVHIVQRSNNMILACGTFSNNVLGASNLTIEHPFPEGREIIDISFKSSNKTKTVNIQEIVLWYGN